MPEQAEVEQALPVARINGVALHGAGGRPPEEELRQRACTELLRQAAQTAGLPGADAPIAADGLISAEASAAIEALLERELVIPEPSDEDCRRHYEAHALRFRKGERVRVRHILFAVTPGVNVAALRRRAETALLDVRCHDGGVTGVFPSAARELSNCPSAAAGGDLGWLAAGDCAPEFARELFGHREVGVLPRLVHSRFGFHVVEVLERDAGAAQPFETVRAAVANALRQQTFMTALRQYLMLLAGAAVVEGVALEAADTPLLQ